MAMDSSGNIIITGWITTATQDFCTVKYSSSGVQQWVAIYNGPGSNSIDQAVAVGVDAQGNVYVTGHSGEGMSNNDYCTVKYNSSGVQQWVRRYNFPGTSDNEAYSLAIDNSGNVYVTGFSGSYSATIKYTPQGDSAWVQRYYSLNALSVSVDNLNNAYVTGASSTQGMVTIKYNITGMQQWVATYLNGSSFKVKLDPQNNIYITGYGDGNKYVSIKYNSSGVQQWKQTYGAIDALPYDLAIDKNQNVIVTGAIFFNNTNRQDYGTIKYNTSGLQQWISSYNGSGNFNDIARSVALDDSGNVYITGTIREIDSSRFGTIKYNPSGVQQWIKTYVGGGNVILVDKYNNVYVAGGNSANGNLDYFTIKYSQFVGIEPISNNLPSEYKLLQNYPNPFNPATTIKFSVPQKSYIQLKIYDVLGRIKEVIVDKELAGSEYEVTFDASAYSSGVYFYQLLANNQMIDTKKLTIIK